MGALGRPAVEIRTTARIVPRRLAGYCIGDVSRVSQSRSGLPLRHAGNRQLGHPADDSLGDTGRGRSGPGEEPRRRTRLPSSRGPSGSRATVAEMVGPRPKRSPNRQLPRLLLTQASGRDVLGFVNNARSFRCGLDSYVELSVASALKEGRPRR